MNLIRNNVGFEELTARAIAYGWISKRADLEVEPKAAGGRKPLPCDDEIVASRREVYRAMARRSYERQKIASRLRTPITPYQEQYLRHLQAKRDCETIGRHNQMPRYKDFGLTLRDSRNQRQIIAQKFYGRG